MTYISGRHALNLPCTLDTCGDWHASALQWHTPFIRDSNESVYGDYGIEHNKKIPESNELYSVANHIRAIMDLLELERYTCARGMRDDFICNDKYTNEIFNLVLWQRKLSHWSKVNDFMKKEYKISWMDFIESEQYG